MDLAPIDALIVEMDAAEAELADRNAGWIAYDALALPSSAATATDEQRAYFTRRIQLQQAVANAALLLRIEMQALFAHGYPVLEVNEISSEAYTDLLWQKRLLEAALATVTTPPAVGVRVTFGDPEKKEGE